MILQWLKHPRESHGIGLNRLETVVPVGKFPLEQIQHGITRRGRQGISSIGVPMVKGLVVLETPQKRIPNASGRQRGAHRQIATG